MPQPIPLYRIFRTECGGYRKVFGSILSIIFGVIALKLYWMFFWKVVLFLTAWVLVQMAKRARLLHRGCSRGHPMPPIG